MYLFTVDTALDLKQSTINCLIEPLGPADFHACECNNTWKQDKTTSNINTLAKTNTQFSVSVLNVQLIEVPLISFFFRLNRPVANLKAHWLNKALPFVLDPSVHESQCPLAISYLTHRSTNLDAHWLFRV